MTMDNHSFVFTITVDIDWENIIKRSKNRNYELFFYNNIIDTFDKNKYFYEYSDYFYFSIWNKNIIQNTDDSSSQLIEKYFVDFICIENTKYDKDWFFNKITLLIVLPIPWLYKTLVFIDSYIHNYKKEVLANPIVKSIIDKQSKRQYIDTMEIDKLLFEYNDLLMNIGRTSDKIKELMRTDISTHHNNMHTITKVISTRKSKITVNKKMLLLYIREARQLVNKYLNQIHRLIRNRAFIDNTYYNNITQWVTDIFRLYVGTEHNTIYIHESDIPIIYGINCEIRSYYQFSAVIQINLNIIIELLEIRKLKRALTNSTIRYADKILYIIDGIYIKHVYSNLYIIKSIGLMRDTYLYKIDDLIENILLYVNKMNLNFLDKKHRLEAFDLIL